MDGLALLRRAQDAGLRLEVAGTTLKIAGPKAAEPLLRLLAERKAQVLEALRQTEGRLCDQPGEGEQSSACPDVDHLYYHAFAALRSKCPELVESDRWRQAIEDTTTFLATWGAEARRLGWTAQELFGLHSVPERPAANYSRLSRYDHTGLIWLLRGKPVIALTASEAAIRADSGAPTVYRRQNKLALGPFGDSLDDMWGRNP